MQDREDCRAEKINSAVVFIRPIRDLAENFILECEAVQISFGFYFVVCSAT